jgi:hypothetical protein
MIKKVMYGLAITAILAATSYAQLSGDLSSGPVKEKPKFSLLDPSRLHMTQSYSLMYSNSKAGSSSLAMYFNSIEYQVSNPLTVRFNIGYLHQPGAILKSGGTSSRGGQIIPGLSLVYRPSDSFLFRFDYRQTPLINDGYPNYIDDNLR